MRNLALVSLALVVVACDGRMHSLGRPNQAHHEAGDGGDDGGVGGTIGIGGVLGGRTGSAGTSAGGKGGAVSRGGSSGDDAPGGRGTSGDSGAGGDAGAPGCGNGVTEPPEESCDDGNQTPGDGCSATCRFELRSMDAGQNALCAVSWGGTAKCWGGNSEGQLGLGIAEQSVGDEPDEIPSSLPAIDLGTGQRATSISPGYFHTCAIVDDGAVKCWGSGVSALGDVGDEPGEMGDNLPTIDLGSGRRATSLALGYYFTCALLDDGAVKCWGWNEYGRLGLGDTEPRGDEPSEMGDNLPAVELGTGLHATAISAGSDHVCALLDDGSVKCWGGGGLLGLGDRESRGDEPDEMGDSLPAVNLGTGRRAISIAAGFSHTCAVLDDGTVKCWGVGDAGQLGIGAHFGFAGGLGMRPGDMGDNLPTVDLGTGRTPVAVASGFADSTCALLDDGSVKCWGVNRAGELGVGDTEPRGGEPDDMGDNLPNANLGSGRRAVSVVAGSSVSCALLDDRTAKCWGSSGSLGHVDLRGDEPGEMGDNLPTVELGF